MHIPLSYIILIVVAIAAAIDWFFFDQAAFSAIGWYLISLFTDIANWIGGWF